MSSTLSKLAKELSILSLPDKKKLLKEIIENSAPSHKAALAEYIWTLAHPDRYQALRLRIEKILTKSPKLTPKVAAQMALYYLKINPRMLPLAIRLARKAKDRLRKRTCKKQKKSNTNKQDA